VDVKKVTLEEIQAMGYNAPSPHDFDEYFDELKVASFQAGQERDWEEVERIEEEIDRVDEIMVYLYEL
jgi:hypothetical protein